MAARKKRQTDDGASLDDYRRKREFSRTPEPRGDAGPGSSDGWQFIVQKHDARNLHYDFRLELGGVLKSWAVPKGPSLDPKQKPLAVLVEDHPLEYAEFEGIIPAGAYGGGTVMVWDIGVWEPIGDPVEGLARGDLKFKLHGEKLRGEWVLARMSGDRSDGGRNWLLIKKKDENARPVGDFNVQAELPFSVISGRMMEEIANSPDAVWTGGRAETVEHTGDPTTARGAVPDPAALDGAIPAPFPKKPRPQLAETDETPPAGDAWIHEVKLDGYRLLACLEDGAVRLLTRNGHDWTDRFPAVARALRRMPLDSAVIDGEVVVLDAAGNPDFGALQNAFGGGPADFTYFVFDIPYAQGHDLSRARLLDRKTFLAEVMTSFPMVAPTVRYCEHFTSEGVVVFEQVARLGLEGIVSKRADAKYVPRRSNTWRKIKHRQRQEFVVGGFTEPAGTRGGFGALLLGHHDASSRLVYCGRVGTGFTDAQLASMREQLDALEITDAPFVNAEQDPDADTAHWVRPELVVQVEFATWTHEDLLRHAAFLGVRADKAARDVVREGASSKKPPAASRAVVRAPASPADAAIAGVRISNPQRTVYPEARVTKREVAEYYAAVAEWILPHVTRRPLSLVRCPLGLAGDSFFQRHVGEGFPPSITGIPHGAEIEGEPYLSIQDLEGLISLAQMGVLEIHTWGCRIDDLEKPDHLVLDLDPGPELTWEHVVAGAHFVGDYIRDLGLESFVKTSGGKGIHIVIPIVRRTSWADAKAFTHAIATSIMRLAPRNFVASMSKSLREYRIFIDYMRNTRGATAVAAYSTRARPGALVSTPLTWDELTPEAVPASFTVKTVPERLAQLDGDPWDGFHETRQSITKAMKRAVGMKV